MPLLRMQAVDAQVNDIVENVNGAAEKAEREERPSGLAEQFDLCSRLKSAFPQ